MPEVLPVGGRALGMVSVISYKLVLPKRRAQVSSPLCISQQLQGSLDKRRGNRDDGSKQQEWKRAVGRIHPEWRVAAALQSCSGRARLCGLEFSCVRQRLDATVRGDQRASSLQPFPKIPPINCVSSPVKGLDEAIDGKQLGEY
ncbi:hypothetical protein TgHK011_006008 [Trichoderma gracile]|nr:hypothetical protein TgHK011_006008 [Trichoderma gracile]